MNETNLSSERKSQLVGGALAALAEEHPVVVSIGWSQSFRDLLFFVAEIVARTPVLVDKRDSIEAPANLILEAYVSLTWKEPLGVMRSTAVVIGVVMSVIFMVLIVCRFLNFEDIPGIVQDLVCSVSGNPVVILLTANVVMILIGMLMEDISGLLS